jgi:hypothetical protein
VSARSCPHGDPYCPCQDGELPCNYETLPSSPRDLCYRYRVADCVCADHVATIHTASDRGLQFHCACGTVGTSIKYAGTPEAEHRRHLDACQYAHEARVAS